MTNSALPRLFSTLCLLLAGVPALCGALYKGAIVVEPATGLTLFEDGADIVTPPASVTKLMTFLLVHDELATDRLSLQTPVTVTADAARMGGSQVYLTEKEAFSVEEMLYALMVSSANDAAAALAVHISGSRDAFVERMNARAHELGLAHTIFRTPHGLPPVSRNLEDGDLTTARDLARLGSHLLTYTDILRYTQVKERVFRPGPKQIDMRNHNNLLGKVAGVDGLKTGFTRGAGYCLAATAERGGRRLVAVTMGSPTSQARDLELASLLEKAFASLPPVPTIQPTVVEAPTASRPAAAATTPITAATTPPASPLVTPVPPEDDPPMVKFTMPGRK